MPTPEKTSVDEIVRAAQEILERDGLTGLTMQAVANRVGVRAPSLYKRVRNRDELIRLTVEASLVDLAHRFGSASNAADLAILFREFGHQRPATFMLVMTPSFGVPSVRMEVVAQASEAVLRHARSLAGEEHALEAARTLTAWATGFIAMELNDGFNLGGDVEKAWKFGLSAMIAALTNSS